MIPLYLFAKAPRPGQVKTRLQAHIGAASCAALAHAMLLESARKVHRHWPGRLVLCVAPDTEAPVFRQLAVELDCAVIRQIDGGLGERMLDALRQGIAEAGAAVVMGCDVPQIPHTVLVEAGSMMVSGENVIGPACDGGFYLLGVHKLVPDLFGGIEWGGERVYEGVMENAARLHITFSTLMTLRDIDVIEDLRWLASRDKKYLGFLDAADRPVF